jgi:enoyl-CoA hydratase/carnithine racemase
MNDLSVSVESGVALLTLDRPQARNALTPALIGELLDTLAAVGGDPDARALVLRGAGGSFCAGYDLNFLTSPGTAEAGRERDEVEQVCSALRTLRMPTIAAVAGVASGAGCDLAMSCDVRFASEDARFAMPPARLGILYSSEGVSRLTALVGPAVAKELLFTGALVDAERALAVGLVNRVVPAAALDDEVAGFAVQVTANARLSVEASKLTVDGASPAALADAQRRVWLSDDAQEGPRAFREGRPPRFEGR